VTSQVQTGRFTALPAPEGSAVFLIGMRVNSLHRPDVWMPAAAAMPRMLRHLSRHPESGLLGFHSWFGRITIILSYWTCAEDLERFATDADAPHAPAWRAFNQKLSRGPHVGIWHETYVIRSESYESIYRNMPLFGLAAATGTEPAKSTRWRDRMSGTATPRARVH